MDKKQAITALSEIVGEFIFKDSLPQGYRGDKSKLNTLASHFGKANITQSVVNQAIDDVAFKEVLAKVKYDVYSTFIDVKRR